MSRSSALKRPPAELPSTPAGEMGSPEPGRAEEGSSVGSGQLGRVIDRERRRGRGTASTVSGRYEPLARVAFDDGWQGLEELPPFKTTVTVDTTRKIITHNDSPDLSFDRSINPYRGCEHGCVYCFARPTHAYLGLSPGLDFESKLFMKPNAPELLERELSAPGYTPRTIAIGTNTDPYQPIERCYQIMRRILEVLDRAGHPAHPRSHSGNWRASRRLRSSSPAARDQGPVSRMADGKFSGPLSPRHQSHSSDARRQGLRFDMGQAHDRLRPDCLDDRAAL